MTSAVTRLFPQLAAGQLDEQVLEAWLLDRHLAHVAEGRRDRHQLRQLALGAADAEQQLVARRLDQLHVAERADRRRHAFRPERAAQRDDLALARRLAQLAERALREQRAVIDDREAIAQA